MPELAGETKYGIFAIKERKENGKLTRKIINSTMISKDEYIKLKLAGNNPDDSIRNIPDGSVIKYRALAFSGDIKKLKIDRDSIINISLEYFITRADAPTQKAG